MTRKEHFQIICMQVRLVRLASEEWKTSISQVNKLFQENGVYEYIENLWGIFHIESDYAVFDDICDYLKNKGIEL